MSNSTSSLLEDVAAQEAIMAAISLPLGSISLLACCIIFIVVIKASLEDTGLMETIWKPRTIFEAFACVNTALGIIVGIYGFVFTCQRLEDPEKNHEGQLAWLYAFLFHRIMLIGGDLFPSLDRCLAILYPLKYYTHASPKIAIGVYLGWMAIACVFTGTAWILDVIPQTFVDLPMAPFYILTNHKFVVTLAIPYLFVLGVVFCSDMIALLIALMRRARMTTPHTSNTFGTASTSEHNRHVLRTSSCVSNGKDSTAAESSATKMSLVELQITIRCLSLTLSYFLTQLCTFLPGVILFGCDLKAQYDENQTIVQACGDILHIQIRIFIYVFYQLQFLKPFFFILFDGELRKAVTRLFRCCNEDDESHLF